MVKIRSLEIFSKNLDEDFSWRIRELTDLRSAVRGSTEQREKTLIRAGTALTYAHLEGFVKKAAELLIAYTASKRLTNSELDDGMLALSAKERIGRFATSDRMDILIDVVKFFRYESNSRSGLRSSLPINTRSNLNFDVLCEILAICSTSDAAFIEHKSFIDDSLLSRRNTIAHGEYLDINRQDFLSLLSEAQAILRKVKVEIEKRAESL